MPGIQACQHPWGTQTILGSFEMQPRHLCNSLLLSAGWFGVKTEGLERKPAVWEARACLGWELEAIRCASATGFLRSFG